MTEVALEGHPHRGCGGRYASRTDTVNIKVSGMHVTVERGRYECDACGDAQYTVAQRDQAERTAIELIRATYGLMSPREIRKVREQTGLSPEQFGQVLYGTPRGVVEGWERGRYLQNQDADALMRSLADRETLVRRAGKADVLLPEILPPEALPGVVAAVEPAMESDAVTDAVTGAAPASEGLVS